MKRSIPLLIFFFALAVNCPAQTLSDSEKVHIVFPFKVGQEYEFMAGDTCYYFTSDYSLNKLPPYTVATITITDTIADGKRYLHIPFWSLASPHMAEYYRLDDSLRIWVGWTSEGGNWWYERFVMDLNGQWEGERRVEGGFCPENFYMYNPHAFCWCSAHNLEDGIYLWGWTTREERPVFRMMCFPAWNDMGPARYVGEQYFGAYGPGSSLHAAGRTSAPKSYEGYTFGGYLGLFRPKSSDPWPEFVTFPKAASGVTAVRDDHGLKRPENVSLVGYPNPFNATVTLRYAVPVGGHVTLRIYNVAGQLIRTLLKRQITAGRYTVVWDGKDDAGRQVASGPYLVRLVTGGRSTAARIALIR